MQMQTPKYWHLRKTQDKNGQDKFSIVYQRATVQVTWQWVSSIQQGNKIIKEIRRSGANVYKDTNKFNAFVRSVFCFIVTCKF